MARKYSKTSPPDDGVEAMFRLLRIVVGVRLTPTNTLRGGVGGATSYYLHALQLHWRHTRDDDIGLICG
jgi:hypothetical protein